MVRSMPAGAQEAISARLRGFGEARLAKMTENDLQQIGDWAGVETCDDPQELIARILDAKKSQPLGPPSDTENPVPTHLLRMSRAPRALQKHIPSPLRHAAEKTEVRSEELVDGIAPWFSESENDTKASPVDENASTAKTSKEMDPNRKVIKPPRHELRIMAFNSLKLRVGDERLAIQWLKLVERMSTNDIVLISEVPSGQATDRVSTMTKMLASVSGVPWTAVTSQASGTSNANANKDVHAAFIRDGVELKSYKTLWTVGGTDLDYAPLQINVVDRRFEKPVEFVCTSVHFPPLRRKSRGTERDIQVAAFLNTYPKEADARMNKPFTNQAAKEVRCDPIVHIVGGDWNIFPAAVDNVDMLPWKTYVGSQVATSAGRQSFDHFVVNAEAGDSYSISWDLVELTWQQHSAKGQIGLSDHHPIELTVKEMPQVRN